MDSPAMSSLKRFALYPGGIVPSLLSAMQLTWTTDTLGSH
jgi:hypothetical protein